MNYPTLSNPHRLEFRTSNFTLAGESNPKQTIVPPEESPKLSRMHTHRDSAFTLIEMHALCVDALTLIEMHGFCVSMPPSSKPCQFELEVKKTWTTAKNFSFRL